MSDPGLLDSVIVECPLKAHRANPFQGLEIPRIRAAPLAPSSLTGRISEVAPLREGESTQLYRAALRIPGFNRIDIVLKTDAYAATPRPKTFTREINAYERKLHSFQGDSIPRCYGLYQLEDDGEVLSFLVLEYSGLPVDFNVEYPEDLKADIINKLTAIHHSGFCHGDIEDHDIVVDNGKAKFTNLEDVEPHDCQIKQVIIPDDLVPSSEDFGCKEIHHVAYMLNVWQKLYLKFYGSDIYLSEILPGRAEHLLWRVRFRLRTKSAIAKAYEEAGHLIQDVERWRKWYNAITDEERKYPFMEDANASEPEDSSSACSSATDNSSDSDSPGIITTSDTSIAT